MLCTRVESNRYPSKLQSSVEGLRFAIAIGMCVSSLLLEIAGNLALGWHMAATVSQFVDDYERDANWVFR